MCLSCFRAAMHLQRGRPRKPWLYVCACGKEKSGYSKRCMACEKTRRVPKIYKGTCEWCQQEFTRRGTRGRPKHDMLRFCKKKCSGALRTSKAIERRRILRELRQEQRRQRPCLHCGLPMGVLGSARLHASCSPAYRKAEYLRRHVSRARPVQGTCLWCGRSFTRPTSNGHPFLCQDRRCRRRWSRAQQRHRYSRSTDPKIVQCRRLLNDVYFAIESTNPRGPDHV